MRRLIGEQLPRLAAAFSQRERYPSFETLTHGCRAAGKCGEPWHDARTLDHTKLAATADTGQRGPCAPADVLLSVFCTRRSPSPSTGYALDGHPLLALVALVLHDLRLLVLPRAWPCDSACRTRWQRERATSRWGSACRWSA